MSKPIPISEIYENQKEFNYAQPIPTNLKQIAVNASTSFLKESVEIDLKHKIKQLESINFYFKKKQFKINFEMIDFNKNNVICKIRFLNIKLNKKVLNVFKEHLEFLLTNSFIFKPTVFNDEVNLNYFNFDCKLSTYEINKNKKDLFLTTNINVSSYSFIQDTYVNSEINLEHHNQTNNDKLIILKNTNDLVIKTFQTKDPKQFVIKDYLAKEKHLNEIVLKVKQNLNKLTFNINNQFYQPSSIIFASDLMNHFDEVDSSTQWIPTFLILNQPLLKKDIHKNTNEKALHDFNIKMQIKHTLPTLIICKYTNDPNLLSQSDLYSLNKTSNNLNNETNLSNEKSSDTKVDNEKNVENEPDVLNEDLITKTEETKDEETFTQNEEDEQSETSLTSNNSFELGTTEETVDNQDFQSEPETLKEEPIAISKTAVLEKLEKPETNNSDSDVSSKPTPKKTKTTKTKSSSTKSKTSTTNKTTKTTSKPTSSTTKKVKPPVKKVFINKPTKKTSTVAK